MGKNVLTHNLSEPLTGATMAKVNIDVADGNLTIDRLADGDPLLASATLEYLEGQDLPSESMNTVNGQATLTLKARSTRRPWFHLPWSACSAATKWHIHLNPQMPSEITAHSGGGNIRMDLAGMAITCLSADTGGGNMEVVLPDHAANLNVIAKSGAGNVTVAVGHDTRGNNEIVAHSGAGDVMVGIPAGIAARIHATTGMGKTIVEPRFNSIDKDTYQSPDYEDCPNKVRIEVHSGAGNVSISAN